MSYEKILEKQYISILSKSDSATITFLDSISHPNAVILYREDDYSHNGKRLRKHLMKYSAAFNHFDLENLNFMNLSKEDNIYLSIISGLLDNPEVLYLNDLLSWLTYEQKNKIISFAKKYNICIVSVTSDIEEVLLFNYMYVIDTNTVLLEGNILDVLKEEKKLRSYGFTLPFYYDLSLQLNYYEVLNDIYLDKKSLESAIWK